MGENCDWYKDSLKLAYLINKYKGRIVIYTGAGISTSVSIPDYRGTNGLWRRQTDLSKPRSKTSKEKEMKAGASASRKLRLPEATFAVPSYTHMALVSLVKLGFVRHVVSQNVDGLHLRSGIPRQKLSEFHGNLFIEQCLACSSCIYRTFDVAEATGRGRHLTGRVCPVCRIEKPEAADHAERGILARVSPKIFKASGSTQVNAFRRAARAFLANEIALERCTPNPPPLLRDSIVHCGERQSPSGLAEIYRVYEAVQAVHGDQSPLLSTPAPTNSNVLEPDRSVTKDLCTVRSQPHNPENLSPSSTPLQYLHSADSLCASELHPTSEDGVEENQTSSRPHRPVVKVTFYLTHEDAPLSTSSSPHVNSDLSHSSNFSSSLSAKTTTLTGEPHAPQDRAQKPYHHISSPRQSASPKLDQNLTPMPPANLIIVLGSSLAVLRHYPFLWPSGLGRCSTLATKGRVSRPRSAKRRRRCYQEKVASSTEAECISSVTVSDSIDGESVVSDTLVPMNPSNPGVCRLAIVSLLPTCKDGLADLVIRAHCDEVMRAVMTSVTSVSHVNHPLLPRSFRHAVNVSSGTDSTGKKNDGGCSNGDVDYSANVDDKKITDALVCCGSSVGNICNAGNNICHSCTSVSDSEKVSCENGLVDKVSDDGVVCPSPGCDSSGTIFSGLGVEVLGYNVFRDDQLLRLATPPSSLFKSAFDEISPPLDLRSNFAPPSSSDYQQPSWEQATRTRPDIPFAQILSRRADLSY